MPFIIYDKNAAHADDNQPVIAGQFAEDELYTVLKDAESVPASLIASLQLRDSDVPLYMEKTNLRDWYNQHFGEFFVSTHSFGSASLKNGRSLICRIFEN